jgi:hypothetical protein
MSERTYWGFACRYPMPAESEGAQDPPTTDQVEETLQRLHDLQAHSAAAM